MRSSAKAWSFVLSGVSMTGFFVACGGGDPRPDSGVFVGDGGLFEATVRDATDEADGGDGSDASDSGLQTCNTKVKDGDETDIDCGGLNACARCALGKACLVKEDCAAGAACTNNVCALCSDTKTDGDETDVDCGGKACGACLVGKHCLTPTDCKSGSCLNQTCACPTNMISISLAGGGAYCIDQAEVSKGEYNQFITANVAVSTQAGACATENTSFVPRAAWPPQTSPGPLEFNYGLPVHYVDWCDAVAYCKWSKKQLCGTITGTGPVPGDAGSVASVSAWYNACSAQGTNLFPYSGAFDATRCNTDGLGTAGTAVTDRGTGFGYPANQDDGVYAVATSNATGSVTAAAHTACFGGSTGLYQMSGNVAEWEDSCDGSSATSKCRVRGGSYASPTSADQQCNAVREVVRVPTAADDLKDVGFRCCLY
jgi:formylglycine-generating enzyme required for sulfatase activity